MKRNYAEKRLWSFLVESVPNIEKTTSQKDNDRMDYGMLINSRGSEWNLWALHVHTASSYDYQNKESDADEQLCQTLLNNNIKAVAITDHFTIDKHKIENLRSIAPLLRLREQISGPLLMQGMH